LKDSIRHLSISLSTAASSDSYKNGIITDIRQVGGYPEYKGKPYKDSDMDGMPDDWEKRMI
jgi:hypothetical protein